MQLIDLLQISISNLMKRRVRTLLTVLGVLIGTTSIVVMVSLGIGLKASVMSEVESIGSLTTIEVRQKDMYNTQNKNTKPRYLDDKLIESLKQLDHVKDVSPQLSTTVLIKCGKYIGNFELVGLTKQGFQNKRIEFAQGGIPEDRKEIALVYGNTLITDFQVEKTGVYSYYEKGELPKIDYMKDKMFIIYDTDRYYEYKNQQSSQGPGDEKSGSDAKVKKPKRFQVQTAGVVAGDENTYSLNSSALFCDLDLLKEQLKRIYGKRAIPGQPVNKAGKPLREMYYTTLEVEADSMEEVADITQMINDMGYEASNSAEWIQSQMKQMNLIQGALGAIGAISLLVAAIGITNTMMMSIYERTKEIGVMKVLGCDMWNIQEMFLMEAGFIGLLGGISGIALSYTLSAVINKVVQTSGMGIERISQIPLWLILPTITFAILIGMVSGFFPSLRAMRLSPLMAIYTE